MNRLKKKILVMLVSLAALSAWALPASAQPVPIDQVCALAGSCTPAGVPGFPVEITESGSYILTSNLVVGDSALESGIHVTTANGHNTTIDLNGFSINGTANCSGHPAVCPGAGSGGKAGVQAEVANVEVRNGTINQMDSGVLVGDNGRVIGVRAVSNAYVGIYMRNTGLAEDNLSDGNGGEGIYADGDGAQIRGNIVKHNDVGIRAIDSAIIAGNTVHEVTYWGIVAGSATLCVENSVTLAGYNGIGLGKGSTAAGNVSSGNLGGISVSEAALVGSNNLYSNDDFGLQTDGATGISENVIEGNGVTILRLDVAPKQLGRNLCNGKRKCRSRRD